MYYDCRTGQKGEVKLRNGDLYLAKMNRDYLVYVEKEGEESFFVILDLDSGKERERIPVGDKVYCEVFEEEILLWDGEERNYYRYAFETGVYEKIENPELSDTFGPFWYTGDGYLGWQFEHNMATEFAYMDKESFDHGGELVALTKNKVPIW